MSIRVRITKGNPTIAKKVREPGEELWISGPLERYIRKGPEAVAKAYGGTIAFQVLADGNDARSAQPADNDSPSPKGGDPDFSAMKVTELRDYLVDKGISTVNETPVAKASKNAMLSFIKNGGLEDALEEDEDEEEEDPEDEEGEEDEQEEED